MLALRVIHQGHRGLGHGGELGDFARMVHAQFHHGDPVLGAQAQQGQGHPNRVIQITLRGQRRAIGYVLLQDGGDHLRDRGLAIAAGHGDQGQGKLCAPGLCQLA